MSTFIRNHTAQPLELHLGAGTVVIGPYEEAAVEDGADATPQIQALARRGYLSVREQASTNPEQATAPKNKVKTPEKGKSRKS